MGLRYNSPTVHWASQQPPEMPCNDVMQSTVSGWPPTGHLDFSQQATFGETSTISSDDKGTAHKPRNLAAAELLTAGMAQIA